MAAGIGVDLEELRKKVFEGVSVEQACQRRYSKKGMNSNSARKAIGDLF